MIDQPSGRDARDQPGAGRDHGTPPDAVLSVRDRIERAGVLAATRVGDHPAGRATATLGLATHVLITRLTTAVTTRLWHACGLPTWRDLNLVREHVALLRHQVTLLEGADEKAEEGA